MRYYDSSDEDVPSRKRNRAAVPSLAELRAQDFEAGGWTEVARESTAVDVKPCDPPEAQACNPAPADQTGNAPGGREPGGREAPTSTIQPDFLFSTELLAIPPLPPAPKFDGDPATFAAKFFERLSQGQFLEYSLKSGWLQQELLKLDEGCPESLARWLFHYTAYSTDEMLATAAFKALRGLLSRGMVQSGDVCGKWPPEDCTTAQEKLKWHPAFGDFATVFQKYGARLGGGDDVATEGAPRMQGIPLNIVLIFETLAFTLRCKPSTFAEAEAIDCARIIARAVLDPSCQALLPAVQMCWAALAEWYSEQSWPQSIPDLCSAMLSEQVTAMTERKLRIARSLPTTQRCRRLQRALGCFLLNADYTQTWVEHEIDLGRVLKTVQGIIQPGKLEPDIVVRLQALELCVDWKPMLEAHRDECKKIMAALKKVKGMLTKRHSLKGDLKAQAEDHLMGIMDKMMLFVPGIQEQDNLIGA